MTGKAKGEAARLEAQLRRSIELSPFPSLLTDPRQPDNPIVAVNEAFCRLTRYAPEEAIGRNCRFLAGPMTEPERSRQLGAAVAARTPTVVELTNHRKDGTPFLNAVMIAPVYDEAEAIAFFIGSQIEVERHEQAAESESQRDARERIAKLAPRQIEVARLMTEGLRNKQIAAKLGISEKTVKMHRAQMLARLEARSSAEAVRLVVEAGTTTRPGGDPRHA
jgi:PAS domain S-box-containing protein